MAVQVLNNLPHPTVRAAVQEAVLGAIGTPNGDWTVQIHENQNSPSWHITIWGPDNFHWSREFFGVDEQNSVDGYAYIRKVIAEVFARLPARSGPVVYLSYAYPDNKDGFVNQLGDRLAQELQVQFGEPIEVVWDPERIRPGATWSTQVEQLLDRTTFLVPVVSPSYFKSDECQKEAEIFLERERRTNRPLLLPVYFVTTGEFGVAAGQTHIAWAEILKRRNILDLRKHRFDLKSQKAVQAIAFFAKSIREGYARFPQEKGAADLGVGAVIEAVDPIFVHSLRLTNFRCFKQIELCFDRPSSLEGRWTCIAGINGAGKSTVLQALSVALLGNPLALELGGERLNRMRRLADVFNRHRATVELELRTAESNQSLRLKLAIDEGRILTVEGPQFAPSPASSWDRIRQLVIAGYGATRNLSSRIDSGSEHLSPDIRHQITLFDPLSQLAGAEVLLERQSASWPFQQLFQNVVRQVFDTELEVGLASPPAGIRFTVSNKDTVEAIDLPDGFRSAAAWIADLCFIWCQKAPDLAASADPADIHAIVLIDEIDLHLHPSLQRALIPRLRKAFPNVQWIVTTHSPLVLANFDVNEIIALDRDRDGNIRELDRQILGFTSDEIYEWLMGTRPMGAAIEEELRKSDEGLGKSQDEVARLMRISPDTSEEAARKQVAEFQETLKILKH